MPRIKRNRAEQRIAESGGPEFLEALSRGLRIIGTFNRARRQLTLSDMARLVGLPRASVRRTLHTLVHLGFAETDGRLFRLTPRVLTLATAYLLSNSISDILQPAVERMSANVGEACSAAILNGHDVITIAHASPNRAINLGAQIGFRLPAISSSLGRVLLATLDDRQLDKLLAQARPEKLTAVTIVDRAELKRAMRIIRWSTKRQKSASARYRCRSEDTTVRSLHLSTSARPATAAPWRLCATFCCRSSPHWRRNCKAN